MNVPPSGATGSWMRGDPSISSGIRSPCQCTVVSSGISFVKWTITSSPAAAWSTGPGNRPLYVSRSSTRPGAISFCV
ncbi:MAG: hypothetical protein M5U28_55200 [Sandaracinaceae bacterium]|nr:hypothetical protein [Sandaracinaceae bacterium]